MARSRGVVAAVVMVAAVLVIQMVASVLSAVIADRTLSAAAEDTYTYVGDLMSERVATFAGAASDVVEGTASEIRRDGTLPTDDELLRALADRLDREPAVGSIFVAEPDGHLVSLATAPDGYSLVEVTPDPAAGGAAITRVEYDAELDETDRTDGSTAYDPTSRPWYQRALGSTAVAWTDPYISSRTDEIVVSPVLAVRDPAGAAVAVVGADLDLDRLGSLLEDIPIGSDAHAFILTGDGKVVAAPAGQRATLHRLQAQLDGVPDASDLGIPTAAPSAIASSSAIRAHGDTVSLERTMDPATGLDWVLHLDASASDLAPAVSGFKRAAYWVTSFSVLMVVVAAGLALQLWRPIRRMREHAQTDALTGLANRYEYARRGRAILRSAQRDGEAVVLIALDLDDFKRVNDEHGHDAGDVVLAAVGDVLNETVRSRDIAARIGGDEFIVLMRLGERGSPVEVARRLRDDVALAIRESFAGGCGAGATAGFATTTAAGHDLATLQSAADEALVSGKRVRKGRTYAFGHGAGTHAPGDDAPEGLSPAGSLPGN